MAKKLNVKNTLLYFVLFFSQSLLAQMPNTDIWLVDIKAVKDSITLSNPVNITNRSGYDNQPSFSPDGKYILYTSIRDEKQSDIYKYDLATKQISQFTNTPATSEYSSTFMPDGKNISVVMVEPDSAQRLWKFPLKGGAPSLIMDKVDSIGYHCWLDHDKLALFLITNPFKLVFTSISSGKSTTIVPDTIGRTLKTLATKSGYTFYYLYKKNIYSIDEKGNKKSFSTYSMNEGEDFCPYKKDRIISGNGPVMQVEKLSENKNSLPAVSKMADFSGYGIKKIMRIAISPDGTKMAFVAE